MVFVDLIFKYTYISYEWNENPLFNINVLKQSCKIDILSPHKLRHYYATSVYNKSLDICLVKELLGHKSITMTQIYLDIDHKDN